MRRPPPPRDNIHLKFNRYEIFVGGKKIFRPYSTFVNRNNDEIKDIHADLIASPDGKILAWIWFGISCFKGSMRGKKYPGLVGLRLRQFNIEIGNDHTLDKFFKEQRGNGYFIGEVHAVDGGLIPNSRRDYFVENDALVEFERALKDYVERNLDKLYHDGIVGYEPSFVFLNHDDLCRLSAKADLCIHCAVIEIEGLSILEAMQQGAVPVIADGPYTGSSQFALDERSLFPAHNPQALAERIDYWLAHPEERWEAGKRYAASVKPYNIANSVEKMIAMFRDALNRQNHVEETA